MAIRPAALSGPPRRPTGPAGYSDSQGDAPPPGCDLRVSPERGTRTSPLAPGDGPPPAV